MKRSALRHLVTTARHSLVRREDFIVASYPKSGNTWLRFLISALGDESPQSFDELSKYVPELNKLIAHRNPLLRLPTGGRFVKTHEMACPRYRRGVYLVRHPALVVQSYYEHQLRCGQFAGSFEKFFYLFLDGAVDGYGNWAEHTRSWLEHCASLPRDFLVIKYEELQLATECKLREVMCLANLPHTIEKLANAVIENNKHNMRRKEDSTKGISKRKGIPFVSTCVRSQHALTPSMNDALQQAFGDVMGCVGYEVST